jgi:hypothetical protein
MVYFIKHTRTDPVCFEQVENFRETLNKQINMLEMMDDITFTYKITIGCAKTAEDAFKE